MLAWPNVKVEYMCVGNREKYLEIVTTDWHNATSKNRQGLLLCFNPLTMCVCVCVFLLCFRCYICKVPWWEGYREFAWVLEGGLGSESTVALNFQNVTLLTSHFKLCAQYKPHIRTLLMYISPCVAAVDWGPSSFGLRDWGWDFSVFSLIQATSESVG